MDYEDDTAYRASAQSAPSQGTQDSINCLHNCSNLHAEVPLLIRASFRLLRSSPRQSRFAYAPVMLINAAYNKHGAKWVLGTSFKMNASILLTSWPANTPFRENVHRMHSAPLQAAEAVRFRCCICVAACTETYSCAQHRRVLSAC